MIEERKGWTTHSYDYNEDQSVSQQSHYTTTAQKPEINRKPLNCFTKEDVHNYQTKADYKANLNQRYLPKKYRYHEVDVTETTEQLRLRNEKINSILGNQDDYLEELDGDRYYEEPSKEFEMQERKYPSSKPAYFPPNNRKNSKRKESEEIQKIMRKEKRAADRMYNDQEPVFKSEGFWGRFKGQLGCGVCDEVRKGKDKKVVIKKGILRNV